MDFYNVESEFIDSLDYLTPPVKRVQNSGEIFGRYNSEANNIQLYREFCNKFTKISDSHLCSKRTLKAGVTSSTSLILKKTSERQILEHYSVLSYPSLQTSNANINFKKNAQECTDKPLIKVTVIPKTDQEQTAKYLRRKRKYALKRVQSTLSNQENSVQTKNVYLVIAGRRRDKIYEIKTTGSATYSTDDTSSNHHTNEERSEVKNLIQSMDMNHNKKDNKDSYNNRPQEVGTNPYDLDETLNPNAVDIKKLSNKSRVKIYGQLGLTDDDRYVLRYGATVNDKPVSDFAQITPSFSPIHIPLEIKTSIDASTDEKKDASVQANKPFEFPQPISANYFVGNKQYYPVPIRESQGTQVNFNVHVSSRTNYVPCSTSDKKVQCNCSSSNINRLIENKCGKVGPKDCNSPLVIISVYPKPSPDDISKYAKAGVETTNAQNFYKSTTQAPLLTQHILQEHKINELGIELHNKEKKTAEIKKVIATKRPSARAAAVTQKYSKQNVKDKSHETKVLRTQIEKKMPDRYKAMRVIKNKILEKDKHSPGSSKLTSPNTRSAARNQGNSRRNSPLRSQEKGTNTEHAKAKQVLVDSYTKQLTEQWNHKDTSPARLDNSKVTVNIDGEHEYYNLLFDQGKLTTDLRIRKTTKDTSSQKLSASLENLLVVPEKEPELQPTSIVMFSKQYDKPLTTERVSGITIRDSIELSHRREDKNYSNVKNAQTSHAGYCSDDFTNVAQFLAPIKHYTGDECSISDPVERDKQIRALLGVDKSKSHLTKTTKAHPSEKDQYPYHCFYRRECMKNQVAGFNLVELCPCLNANRKKVMYIASKTYDADDSSECYDDPPVSSRAKHVKLLERKHTAYNEKTQSRPYNLEQKYINPTYMKRKYTHPTSTGQQYIQPACKQQQNTYSACAGQNISHGVCKEQVNTQSGCAEQKCTQPDSTQQVYTEPTLTEQSLTHAFSTVLTCIQPDCVEQKYARPTYTEAQFAHPACTAQNYTHPDNTERQYTQPTGGGQHCIQTASIEHKYAQPICAEQIRTHQVCTDQKYTHPPCLEQLYTRPVGTEKFVAQTKTQPVCAEQKMFTHIACTELNYGHHVSKKQKFPYVPDREQQFNHPNRVEEKYTHQVYAQQKYTHTGLMEQKYIQQVIPEQTYTDNFYTDKNIDDIKGFPPQPFSIVKTLIDENLDSAYGLSQTDTILNVSHRLPGYFLDCECPPDTACKDLNNLDHFMNCDYPCKNQSEKATNTDVYISAVNTELPCPSPPKINVEVDSDVASNLDEEQKEALAYQQLVLNRNIQVFLQVEQFSKQRPIILSRKQYNKVKKTIQNTIVCNKSSREQRKVLQKHDLSDMSFGEIRKKDPIQLCHFFDREIQTELVACNKSNCRRTNRRHRMISKMKHHGMRPRRRQSGDEQKYKGHNRNYDCGRIEKGFNDNSTLEFNHDYEKYPMKRCESRCRGNEERYRRACDLNKGCANRPDYNKVDHRGHSRHYRPSRERKRSSTGHLPGVGPRVRNDESSRGGNYEGVEERTQSDEYEKSENLLKNNYASYRPSKDHRKSLSEEHLRDAVRRKEIGEPQRKSEERPKAMGERSRVGEERSRVRGERSRLGQESSKASRENKRVSHEGSKVIGERKRNSIEHQKVSADHRRTSGEHPRVSAERQKSSGEQPRVSTEHEKTNEEQPIVNTEPQQFSDEQKAVSEEDLRTIYDHSKVRTNVMHSRLSAERQRTSGEHPRIGAERQRTSGEYQRVSAERQRTSGENPRVSEERQRTSGEHLRVSEERQRTRGEQPRVSAERQRISREHPKVSEERQRSNIEQPRVSAVRQRTSGEHRRTSAERQRSNVEHSRERQRSNGEPLRVAAERQRSTRKHQKVNAERQRSNGEQPNESTERQKSSREHRKTSVEHQKSSEEQSKGSTERQRSSREHRKTSAERQKSSGEQSKVSAERQKSSREHQRTNTERQKSSGEQLRVCAERQRSNEEQLKECGSLYPTLNRKEGKQCRSCTRTCHYRTSICSIWRNESMEYFRNGNIASIDQTSLSCEKESIESDEESKITSRDDESVGEQRQEDNIDHYEEEKIINIELESVSSERRKECIEHTCVSRDQSSIIGECRRSSGERKRSSTVGRKFNDKEVRTVMHTSERIARSKSEYVKRRRQEEREVQYSIVHDLRNNDNCEKTRPDFEDMPIETELPSPIPQAGSSLEIHYTSVSYLKHIDLSSSEVAVVSDSSLGHVNSFQTLFRGHRKSATPNLGTSIYSLYTEDGFNSEKSAKYIMPPRNGKPPKRPFLMRLMSCLVMRSARASALKLPTSAAQELSSVNSSVDSYHISTSLGGVEVTSSIYDTTASFYSNHTIMPINSKMKRGFFNSVRGFLTNRKS